MELVPVLLRVVVVLVALTLLVRWLEPRMAFFPIRGVQETPAALGLPFADIHIPTADGETLHAWWLEDPDARAQVIFFHGNGGNLSLWLDVLASLRRRGLSVLAVDFRGYGASTGKPTERGLYKDAEASLVIFRERLRRRDVPVLYWGRSIGAPIAAHAANVAAPDGLVLETPMPDVRTVLRSNPVMWLLSFLSSYRLPTSRLLEEYRGPLLVVHGDRDSIVPFSAGRQVFERAPTPQKTFVVIPGADHNDLHVVASERYWRSIDVFISSLRPVAHD
jgi:hypothetical protein